MRVLIRTDLGGAHGMGHARRCLALARALAACGADVRFVTTTAGLLDFVAPFSAHLWCDGALVRRPPNDIYVVDTKVRIPTHHYEETRRDGTCVVRMDHPHAAPDTCDLLIGSCVHWSPETVTRLRQGFGDRLLYGWDYVMVDDAVTQRPPVPYAEREHGPIMFCAGGSDPTGALEKMYRWTADIQIETVMQFGVGQYATIPQVSDVMRHTPTMLTPFRHTLLQRAALVVGLFGVTCYEALWYHTPMLCFAHTEENCLGAVQLQQVSSGAIQTPFAMDIRTMDAQYFREQLQWTWDYARGGMHTASAGLLDGLGVPRVADAILGVAS